eukprot:1817603-Pyramimonas_sp.AAC.1
MVLYKKGTGTGRTLEPRPSDPDREMLIEGKALEDCGKEDEPLTPEKVIEQADGLRGAAKGAI